MPAGPHARSPTYLARLATEPPSHTAADQPRAGGLAGRGYPVLR